ncbi:hypothetical protein DFJ74DRAFT_676909 [Hyaloraphidium curvatum]|nr:hypothetical protein DFJ74DRAFT_676909 [Hyaloraphidium curvatum]
MPRLHMLRRLGSPVLLALAVAALALATLGVSYRNLSPAARLWDTTFGANWTMWPGGFCRAGRSLLPDVPDWVCERQECLRAPNVNRIVVLDDLLRGTAWKRKENRSAVCEPPRGGQRKQAGVGSAGPVVSFIFTLHNKPLMAAVSILDAFRSARELSSAEFVILDDASSDDMSLVSILCANLRNLFGADVTMLRNRVSAGYGASNNAALSYARGELALLLNSDLSLLPGALTLLLRTMRSFPRAGMVGPLMVSPQGTVMEAGGTVFRYAVPANFGRGSMPAELPLQHARAVDYISAACLLVRRKLFLGLGLFDKQFEPAYYEDTDAAFTHLRSGYLTVLQPLALAVHAEGSSYSDASKTTLMNSRQRLFHAKHRDVLDSYCPTLEPDCQDVTYTEAMVYSSVTRQPAQILVLEDIVPEPDRDSGSIRLAETLRILVSLGYSVSFEAQTGAVSRGVRYMLPLVADGVNVLPPGSVKDVSKRASFKGSQPETMVNEERRCPWKIIWIARRGVFRQHIDTVRKLCPGTPIVYDTIDLHFLRERRAFELDLQAQSGKGNGHLVMKDKELGDSEAVELGFVKMSNTTIVVSPSEATILAQKVPGSNVVLLSNIYPDPVKTPGNFSGRQGALFVGNMCHPPNRDAVRFIVEDILKQGPSPKWDPGFRMHFVWSNSRGCPDPVLEAAEAHPLVRVHRDVSDQELIDIHSKVLMLVAPLRYGAGVKGKVNFALLQGLPVVGSRMAIEGMFLVDGESALVAETGGDFRGAMDRLSNNRDLWSKLREGGWAVMKKHFSRDVAASTLTRLLSDLGAPPPIAHNGSLARPCQVDLAAPLPDSCGSCWHCSQNPLYFPPPLLPFTDPRYFAY